MLPQRSQETGHAEENKLNLEEEEHIWMEGRRSD
jgi:hypothetical protein